MISGSHYLLTDGCPPPSPPNQHPNSLSSRTLTRGANDALILFVLVFLLRVNRRDNIESESRVGKNDDNLLAHAAIIIMGY